MRSDKFGAYEAARFHISSVVLLQFEAVPPFPLSPGASPSNSRQVAEHSVDSHLAQFTCEQSILDELLVCFLVCFKGSPHVGTA